MLLFIRNKQSGATRNLLIFLFDRYLAVLIYILRVMFDRGIMLYLVYGQASAPAELVRAV
jgi:hypothetical protein